MARDGGYIASGYHLKLDETRALKENANRLKEQLQVKYQKETAIPTLKVKTNNVLGYFIEITPQHSGKMAGRESFIHRQTLANAVRYTTEELKQLENNIVSAKERILCIEVEIFDQLIQQVQSQAAKIVVTAHALAALDVTAALARLAVDNHYTRPHVDGSMEFSINKGRHPVVEDLLQKASVDGFIPNDCKLSGTQRLWLLTGPNMAGKSTFLRQNALIAILAQIGSFVPAETAHIGVVDRLFSRVGAADDLAQGRSTFMVEMVETATILNQSSERSLVILDEIGRGTATFDGVSIAWSVVEHLHNANRCRALFATHYHELTSLSETLQHLQCYTMRVKEWKGNVVFLHEVESGSADRSYGIHVAKLAGLPKSVIKRSKEVLHQLENAGTGGAVAQLAGAMPLFSFTETQEEAVSEAYSEVEEMLESKDLNELTPKEALDFLYSLKEVME